MKQLLCKSFHNIDAGFWQLFYIDCYSQLIFLIMKLTDWIIIDEYCATKVLEGTDSNKVENRIAFIEKTPRVRIAPFTDVDDYKNWKFGDKGSEYGMDEESRKWCDAELLKLGYQL